MFRVFNKIDKGLNFFFKKRVSEAGVLFLTLWMLNYFLS